MAKAYKPRLPPVLAGINQIPGWLSENEAIWLCQQAASRPRILEIGCWKGRSTFALCTCCKGQVWSVDHFQGAVGEDKFWYDNASGGNFDQVRAECLRNLRKFSVTGRWLLFDMPADNFYELFPHIFKHHQFDMVWIDGSHDRESVTFDIQNCLKLLTPTGLLCGHDIHHHGVKMAANSLLPGYRHIPETTIWAIDRNQVNT